MTQDASGGRPYDVLDARCPSHEVMLLLTRRWVPQVLLAMGEGLTRFGEIHRRVGGSSERMVSQTLQTLVADGLVERTTDESGRPEYGLTPGGREIAAGMRGLSDAVCAHLDLQARGG